MSEKQAYISQSAEYARLGTQIAIILNGGALVAIPPFYQLIKDTSTPILVLLILLPGLFHAIGLFLGVSSIITGFRHFDALRRLTEAAEARKEPIKSEATRTLRQGFEEVSGALVVFLIGVIVSFMVVFATQQHGILGQPAKLL